ncbi:hypothetical protein [Nostoc sp.]|uniref:hypothetical protein n=1 Tax=Nostoc sp. TaxID=1180 RepID=UPI002FFC42C6
MPHPFSIPPHSPHTPHTSHTHSRQSFQLFLVPFGQAQRLDLTFRDRSFSIWF